MVLMAGLLGVLAGFGIVLFIVAMRGETLTSRLTRTARKANERTVKEKVETSLTRIAIGVVVGLLVTLLTRWPVAGILFGIGASMLPGVLERGRASKVSLARVEAIASWAEMIRDTMAGAGGLEQSIMACAPIAPTPIRREVVRLAARLERDRLAPSLREFAEELDDPTGDLVVASLVLAADKNPKKLGELLGMLAASAREEVRMRLRVEAGRARARTSVKVVIGAVVLITSGIVLLNRPFLDAYDSLVGQFVLALIGIWFAGGFALLSRMTKFTETERFLTEDLDFGEARI